METCSITENLYTEYSKKAMKKKKNRKTGHRKYMRIFAGEHTYYPYSKVFE